MNNIQKRVAELHEKDEAIKQRQLKEVEDFYRLIEEDLMVGVLYREVVFIRSLSTWGNWGCSSRTYIQDLYKQMTNVDEENLEYLGNLNSIQREKFIELFEISLKGIGYFLIKKNDYSGHTYAERDRYEITNKKPIEPIETIVVKDEPPEYITWLLLLALVIVLIIGCIIS
jgi:hypothetical protein